MTETIHTMADAIEDFIVKFAVWWTAYDEAARPARRDCRAARAVLCTAAGCPNPGKGHLIRECRIDPETDQLCRAIRATRFPALDVGGHIAKSAKRLETRITELGKDHR